ncbi:hypothetical protein [Vibrio hyugaensis]|uniref:hypothetical protein n=1 Tax=Vibrio hyugaensis TaxID=1534743 RepID=UPI0005EEB512|nr:hypothetical protein [Vibrio hyugaensis]
MILRSALQPKEVDSILLKRLTELASEIDGGEEKESTSKIIEFNYLTETNHQFADFQGIYGGDGHREWVHRLLKLKSIVPQSNITKSELAEVVRLATLGDESYLGILEKNVTYPFASDLIFYPSDVFKNRNEEPTEQEIVDFLINYKTTELPKLEQLRLFEKHLVQGLSRDEFRLLSENLTGFDLNYLANWLSSCSFSPSEALELIHNGEMVSDYAATISLQLEGTEKSES